MSQSFAERPPTTGLLVLGIDTCGPAGSVALARLDGSAARILGQMELAERSYSATLVAAVGALLAAQGAKLSEVRAIVVVSGPGSFTGVRVGLSAVKGLAEPGQIPVAAVSRLAVLATKAGLNAAALDAHRHEVFLRVQSAGEIRESLAGAEQLAAIDIAAVRIAVCDDAAAELLQSVWPQAELSRSEAPTAGDAIRVCAPQILAGSFEDLALLDGHYLRRSDAEIFGDPTSEKVRQAAGKVSNLIYDGAPVRIRRMTRADLDGVVELAAGLKDAPHWPHSDYADMLEGSFSQRVAVVAEDAGTKVLAGFAVARVVAPEAELESITVRAGHQRRGVARQLFASLREEFDRLLVRQVMLEVREGNGAARAFYRSAGFVEEGRRLRYYADPVEDAILMRMRMG